MSLFSFLNKSKKQDLPTPSHFTTIGFFIDDPKSFGELTKKIVERGSTSELPDKLGGFYYVLSLSEGIELWLVVDKNAIITCFNPYFKSKNRNKVKIMNKVSDPKCQYEGSFYAWAGATQTNDKDEGNFPFVFTCPDYLKHASQTFPKLNDITITAFTHHIELFPDKEAYEKSQKEKPRLATQAFIPSGLFLPGGQKIDPPEPQAIFTGIVEEGKIMKNSLTGKEFYWALVKTYSLTLDILIDKRLIPATPQKGNVVSATAWIIGDWINH